MSRNQQRALGWYLMSMLVFVLGVLMSARLYPGGYDWFYTVVSDLASQKHNPAAGLWFSGAMSLSMALLWPYATLLKQETAPAIPAVKYTFTALRLALIGAAMIGAEKFFVVDISSSFHKSHELMALITFAAFYSGVLGLLLQMMSRHRAYLLPALLVALPLLAIALTELLLYLEQMEVGWVNPRWRQFGIPLWRSFAFWQWLAIVFLWLGLGTLIFISSPSRHD